MIPNNYCGSDESPFSCNHLRNTFALASAASMSFWTPCSLLRTASSGVALASGVTHRFGIRVR